LVGIVGSWEGLVGATPFQVAPLDQAVLDDGSQECIKNLNDGFGIHKTELRMTKPSPNGTVAYQVFRDLFSPDASDLTKSHFILVEYTAADAEAVSTLERVNTHMRTLDVLFDVTATSGCISSFIYKQMYSKLRGLLEIGGMKPAAVYRLTNPKGGGVVAAKQKQLDVFLCRERLATERFGNMCIKKLVEAQPGFLSVFKEFLDENAHAIHAMGASDRAVARRMFVERV